MNNRTQRRYNATRTIAATLFLVASVIAGTANAITVTLDNAHQTVVRPDTGTTRVDFTGHITIDDDYLCCGSIQDALYDASGVFFGFPTATGLLDGVLFYFDISDRSPLGLFAFNNTRTDPVGYTFYDCPPTIGICSGATVTYSLNVVAASVPEPATLGLVSIGFLGFVVARRASRVSDAMKYWRHVESA